MLLCCLTVQAQNISAKLQQAFTTFESDPQLSSALSSLYVVDAKTGNIVFEKNSRIGLAPASTQKVITAATAYALLGKDFQYKTEFGYMGETSGRQLRGVFYVQPSFDPTLGSWRWTYTADTALTRQWISVTQKFGVTNYAHVQVLDSTMPSDRVLDGWIWQDIGNYYGAGAGQFNWRENQIDLVLKSGKAIGSPVQLIRQVPAISQIAIVSHVRAAAKGTGDNAYVYYPLGTAMGIITGTIPIEEDAFVISASLSDPVKAFTVFFQNRLQTVTGIRQKYVDSYNPRRTVLHTHFSPTLDSINYWFQKKSINLYGEALIKTIAYQKESDGSTEKGIAILKNFWKGQGLAPTELNMVDGSGLSPLNRVTTHAQVEVLRFAKAQNWFAGYYDALPVYNDMKMKSGTINGAKGFCGYHRSKDGTEYIFSFLVNNYNGSASALVRKMYAVLDVLK